MAEATYKVDNLRPFENAKKTTWTNPNTGKVYQQYLGEYQGVVVNVWVAEGHIPFIDSIRFNVLSNGSAWSTLPKSILDNMAAFGITPEE